MIVVPNDLKQSLVKKRLGIPMVKFVIGVSIFLLSAAFFGLVSLNVVIKKGEKVTVPNIVNKSVVEALDLLSERRLELRKSGARNSSVIPENYILSQDPLPGTVVKEGGAVSVVISLGSKLAVVPNLVGKSLREARIELNRAGLSTGRLSRIHYNSEKDVVLAQSIPPDQQLDRITPVDMLLSLGSRPRKYRAPDFIGVSLEKASEILDAMGMILGDISTKVDLTHPQGVILDQDPRPGSLIAEGSTVSLVISTLYGEGNRLDRKFAVFLYQVPYGFWSKSVKIAVSDPEGSKTIYNEIDEPGANIKVVFGYSVQCTVKVYLDGKLETERIIR